jgi:glycerol-3-phosphate O-acyltransferase/dihydroxyacetone phosphate acyltransferase
MVISVADEPLADRSVRELFVATFRCVMRLYFRDIERLGEPPGPEVRGRVFVSNHTNAMIDALLVITGAACEISPIAKSTLWSVPGLAWLLDLAGAMPIIRRIDVPDKAAAANADTFDRVAAHLAGGGNVLIFPEGTSHSEPHLAPLRSGAARMLIAAGERRGVAPTFQAVGLEFDARSDFRSRCLVLWGPVRTLADVPGTGRARVRAITARMAADLAELLVEGETHEDRLRIARAAELLAHDAGEGSLGAWSGIGRRVGLALRALRRIDAELAARISERVDSYFAELERLGLSDGQIAGQLSATRPAEPAWRRAARAPLATAGFALYAIPSFLPRWIARSSDPDTVSTIKLGAALVVYPLWATSLVTGALVALPPPLAVAGAAIAVAAPFAALRWLDACYLRTRDAAPGDLERLRSLRCAACAAIDQACRWLPA